MVVVLAAVMARQTTAGDYPVAQGSNSAAPVPRAPDVEPARQAVHHALLWLGEQVASPDLNRALRAGAGLALGWEFPDAASIIRERLEQLHRRLAAGTSEALPWEVLGADTMLLVAHGMQQVGIKEGVVDEDVTALAASLDVPDLMMAPAALPASVLLARLGKLDPRLVRRAVRRTPSVRPADVEAPDAVQCAANLLQLSGGDPARLAWPADDTARLVDQLGSGLLTAAHNYQLGDAATLLRALALLGRRTDRLTRDAISYLLSQQRPDGAFGYLAGTVPAPADIDVHLAWTLGGLWALLDIVFPQYSPTRLFSLAPTPVSVSQPANRRDLRGVAL
jgi:hypothetical protein